MGVHELVKKLEEEFNVDCCIRNGHYNNFNLNGLSISISHSKFNCSVTGFPGNCGTLIFYYYNLYDRDMKTIVEKIEQILNFIGEHVKVKHFITVLGERPTFSNERGLLEQLGFVKVNTYPNPTHEGVDQSLYSKVLN